MLHKLRRTLAVTCLLACACFVVLWMRGTRHWDTFDFHFRDNGRVSVQSFDIGVYCFYSDKPAFAYPGLNVDLPTDKTCVTYHTQVWTNGIRWNYLPAIHREEPVGFMLPHWFLVAATGATGCILSIQRTIRFSLRTLAIAATAIVLTLGVGVAAGRPSLG